MIIQLHEADSKGLVAITAFGLVLTLSIELPMQRQICDVCTLAAPQLCLAFESPTVAAGRLVRPQAYPSYDSSPRPSYRVFRVLTVVHAFTGSCRRSPTTSSSTREPRITTLPFPDL